MKRIFRSKVFWAIIVLLVAVRLIIPPLIVPKVNEFLADFSPVFKAHIEDLGIHLIRGAYSVRGLEVSLKEKPEERFIQTEVIDVSIAWRELFRGRVTADVVITGNRTLLTDDVLAGIKKMKDQAKQDTKKSVDKVIPLKITKIKIKDSSFEIADVYKLPPEARWRLTNINGEITNVLPDEQAPLTLAVLQGSLLDSAPVKVSAQINRTKEPMVWDADIQINDFALAKANPILKRKLPLTFTSGTFDLYSEVKSENGFIRGYAKPFFKKADVVSTGEDFKNLRHYGIEASTAAVNLLLRSSKEKTMATKVAFTYGKDGIEINSAKAISEAIENSFGDEVPEGIENSISLSDKSQEVIQKEDKP